MSVDIPDEAYKLGVYWRSRPNAVKTRVAEVDTELADRLDDIPSWATVDTRAAQVKILREMAEVFHARAKAGFDQAEHLTEPEASESAEHIAVGFDHAAEALEDKAAELDACGGQTGPEVAGDE